MFQSMFMEKLTQQEELAMFAMPPYTTLASTISNLEKKTCLTGRKTGNVYEYTPVIEEEEYNQKFMNGFVRLFRRLL